MSNGIIIIDEVAFIPDDHLPVARTPMMTGTFQPHNVCMISSPQIHPPPPSPAHPPAEEQRNQLIYDKLPSDSPLDEIKVGGAFSLDKLNNAEFLDPEFLRSLSVDSKLRRYYEQHFPWTSLCAWLCINLASDVNSYAIRDKFGREAALPTVVANLRPVVNASSPSIGSKRSATESVDSSSTSSDPEQKTNNNNNLLDPTLSLEEVTASHGTHKRLCMDMLNVLVPVRLPALLAPPAPEKLELREFCFQYPDNRFRRFITARTPEELQAKATFSDIRQQVPLRIEVGPAYTSPPSLRNHASPVVGESKELVLDIDITDYNEVRPCCRGSKNTCPQCWSLIRFAMKLITAFLRTNLGIACIQWVYSGQKGVHCWIPGAYVARLSAQDRAKIMRLLNIKSKLAVSVTSELFVNHSQLYLDYFLERITKHNILADQLMIDICLSLIPCNTTQAIVKNKMGSNSVANWNIIHQQIEIAADRAKLKNCLSFARKLTNAPKEMMIYAVTPRVDEQVARVDHLVKTPFSIHPGTMRVCVPIGLDNIDKFQPEDAPTLDQVISRSPGTTVITLK